MSMTATRNVALSLAISVFAGACSGDPSTGTGTATLRIQLTDGPGIEYDSAIVYIGAVTIRPVGGDAILITDEGGRFDLLDLQNGVTAELGELEVDPGEYHELRMIVDSAYVGLADPYEFDDGTTERDLKVPSGSSSGIKVKLRAADGDGDVDGVTIVPGETILVVDFDVYQNFKTQGNPNTPAGLKGVLFTPTLRATVRNVAGSIAGTVTAAADDSPLPGLTVRATLQGTPAGEDPVEATAITQDDGTYVIRFLAPGTYDVTVDAFTADPPESMPQAVPVGAGEAVTGVDFSGTST